MNKFDIESLLNKSFSDGQQNIDLYELFEKKCHDYNLSVTHARDLLGMDHRTLLSILNGTAKQPSLISVMKVADFLEIDIQKMIQSMVSKQDPENISRLTEAKKASFIAKNFDVDRLYSDGFLKDKNDSNSIVDRILSFFGFTTITEYENFSDKLGLTVFSKSKRNFIDKMRHFSIHSAYRLFEEIDNPNPYDREALLDLMPKIKPFSQDVENGLYTVCKALFSHGVTVIFQNHLKTSQFRGATMFVKGNPCIVITNLNKNYATIWFALLHELYHVLFDEEEIESSGYHLTNDEIQLTLIDEDAADQFAGDYFVDSSELKYVIPHIHNEELVARFAKKIKCHRSIVYSRYQFYMDSAEKKNYWGAFKDHFPKPEKAISRLNPISWKEDYSIPLIAENLKEIFDLKTEHEKATRTGQKPTRTEEKTAAAGEKAPRNA